MSVRLAPKLVAEVERQAGHTISTGEAVQILRTAIDAVKLTSSPVRTRSSAGAVHTVAPGRTPTAARPRASTVNQRLPDPIPINATRSAQVKARTHALCIGGFVLWFLVIGIVVGAISAHLGMGAGVGWMAALLGTGPMWLLTVPLTLVIFRKHFRDWDQYDYPTKPVVPKPHAYDLRPKPKLEMGSFLNTADYPMLSLLDPDWLERYRFLPDEDLPRAVADMCDEVLRNWNCEHPNAPQSGFRPLWFEDMRDQAEVLLSELQRAEKVLFPSKTSKENAERYFQTHSRWPDDWYRQRRLPIPPPGPDPEWFMPNPAATLANAAIVAGAVYLGAFRPISKAIKKL
jgi:hypothetical protein